MPDTVSDWTRRLKTELERAIKSYQAFSASEIPPDAKGFGTYHNACKSALLHIALLQKLMALNGEKQSADLTVQAWLNRAQTALQEDMSDDLFIE